jgi:hypothetical protein
MPAPIFTFQLKPHKIRVIQWFTNGDHPEDEVETVSTEASYTQGEGKIVRYFRSPVLNGSQKCFLCGISMHFHGWIDQGANGDTVCPGDWVTVSSRHSHYQVIRPNALLRDYQLCPSE